jgi:nitroimidazol reductase NimA-like FMN-containing flavoprotein (pyridoxamine 5'-phosphate oxidase superfamily)
MFREIRKKKNEIGEEAIKSLLRSSRRGILAVNGDNGYPYAIPINYLYDEESQRIFFHGSRIGHKIDTLKSSNKICFTVCGNEMIAKEDWAPFVQSAIIFGRCHLIENMEMALATLKKFSMKYYPSEDMVIAEIEAAGKAVQMFEIEIEHISGKEVQER